MDKDRYSRQIRFRAIGENGQTALSQKHVIVIGAGALGSGIAETLTRAGIGTLTIIDRDYVESSNLQRQSLYSNADAAARLPKAIAARNRLNEINPDVVIHAHVLDAAPADLEKLVPGADLLMDGTDNFDTRLIVNDLAQKHGIPWIYGACVGSSGMSFTILPGSTPCLSCLLASGIMTGETCDIGGIVAPAVQAVVAHQTVEALKLLTGNEMDLRQTFLTFDLWRNQHYEVDLSGMRNPGCPSCGSERTYPHLAAGSRLKAAVLCGRDTVQLRPSNGLPLNLNQLAELLERLDGHLDRNPYLLSYSHEDKRLVFFPDGRVLVHGTNSIAEAKRLYHGLIG
ncbi:ThiF family adenylyltransferase [Gorillibacterium timonense]|uniref:ThiF family adenylyltransferase n=1 Tax=Gorillibacterium timonense TaxID=1689269 RepID=UPI00071C6C5C|nr:ThiF family adenylyltransferase [Gorillibacterium timonense]